MTNASSPKFPPLGVFRHSAFAKFWVTRVVSQLGLQMQATAIGWQVYELARQTMSIEKASFLLGMIGLAQFMPLFLLSFIGGQAADRFNRKTIVFIFIIVDFVLSAALFTSTFLDNKTAMALIFFVAVGFGLVRTFQPPAISALGPSLVPKEELPQAIAWNSLAWQSSSVLGPALGGIIYIFGAKSVYLTCGIMQIIAAILLLMTQVPKQNYAKAGSDTIKLIKEGLNFVWHNKLVLGSISLDLAVVLLAGATALMPVFAKDVLHTGPEGLGLLRASPAIGAVIVGLILANRPIRSKVGIWMFSSVIIFGVATVGFGYSRLLWLSIFWLIISGAADMVSVFVRTNLIQMATPDEMRGRVSAVSGLFISASNEFGEFQSGLFARFIGPINAVLFGGYGAILVSALWTRLFKPLAAADKIADIRDRQD